MGPFWLDWEMWWAACPSQVPRVGGSLLALTPHSLLHPSKFWSLWGGLDQHSETTQACQSLRPHHQLPPWTWPGGDMGKVTFPVHSSTAAPAPSAK